MPTDAEIRTQLAEQIEAEGRGIRVESPADGPPLLCLYPYRLKPEAIARFRQAWEDTWKRPVGEAPRFVLLEEAELYQLIDGEWRKLG